MLLNESKADEVRRRADRGPNPPMEAAKAVTSMRLVPNFTCVK